MAAGPDVNSRIYALRVSQMLGCSGAHQQDGKWMPCETHEELERLSNEAEPNKKSSLQEMGERYTKRRAKGKNKRKGWEKLRETRPLGGFATLEGGGIVSAPINSTIYSGGVKSYIPSVSPRDNDTDVFTDIESARRRSRMLGCIGVRRMPSATGRTVWMPCTNNTDYARLAGTTFLGRRNQQEAQRRVVRTIVRREISDLAKRGIRKKSLHSEIYETKGIGRIIGRANGPGSLTRRMRRSMAKITGELNPMERRDVDGDGVIFDGTWREMPDPSTGLASRARRPRAERSLQTEANWWHSPKDNKTWFTPKNIKKGGVLKAQDLLNFDRVRLRKNRDEQAKVMGVSRETIDAMYEPDASIDPFDADRLAVSAFDMHPALIWGEDWLKSDLVEPPKERINKLGTKKKIPGRKPGELDERDELIFELVSQGKNQSEIGRQLGISRERVRQLYTRALKRNETRIDREDGLSSNTGLGERGGGMIRRDEQGKPIRQADRRKETLQRSVDKLKSLGLSDEEINFLMTGDRNTPVDTETRDIDIAKAKRDPRSGGLNSRTDGLRSMSLSEMANSSPKTWPDTQKKHITNWGNSKPSFNVPYALAQKFLRDGDLSDSEWKRLLNFYTKYGPESRGGLRSSTTSTADFTNVGASRMVDIILGRVKGKKDKGKTHYHIVGPGGMGKTTLKDYLIREGLIPADTSAAHVDPDFIKQGINGYNGGAGSVSVHRESAQAATKAVNTAAKDGMDIVTEGTGYRLYEYKSTSDADYRKVLHIPYLPFSVAEERVRTRNSAGGRQLPPGQVRLKGEQFYSWLTDHIGRGEVQSMYIWDMDVPQGAAPKVIAKIEDGVFRAIDEPAFKKWSEQSGGRRGGDSNLAWFKRRYPENQ